MNETIPLCPPTIDEKDIEAVVKALKSGWLAHGECNEKFEDAFARYTGTKFALSLNSCTSALELALWACDIRGEVIVPSFTWVSTVNVVALQGCTPVFADIDLNTFCLDIKDVEAKITPQTEAIILVHYAGLATKLREFKELADKHSLLLIEDSAEAIGATDKSVVSGSIGLGCFSFYPTKNMTTCEGGMLTTNDELIYRRSKALSAHGIYKSASDRERLKGREKWMREASEPGRNFRMPNPLAAMGITQLEKLDQMNDARRSIADVYRESFEAIPDLRVQAEPSGCKHVYQMFPVVVSNKSKVIDKLNALGIMASSHFDPPVHQQEAFERWRSFDLPNTELISSSVVTLPIFPSMSASQVKSVCKALHGIS